MINKVIFVSQACAETTGPWKNWAIISIHDPDVSAKPKIKEGWHAVLRLAFHDVTPKSHGLNSSYVFMTEEDALKLVYFVGTVAPEVDGIIVHCKAGISRSAAVAKWISGQFRIPFGREYKHHNEFVYELLCKAGKESQSIR